MLVVFDNNTKINTKHFFELDIDICIIYTNCSYLKFSDKQLSFLFD